MIKRRMFILIFSGLVGVPLIARTLSFITTRHETTHDKPSTDGEKLQFGFTILGWNEKHIPNHREISPTKVLHLTKSWKSNWL